MPKHKYTQEEFINKMKIVNNNILVIGEYEKSKIKIDIQCKKCKHKWSSLPCSLLQGRGCPKCGGIIKKDIEDIIKDIPDLKNGNYIILKEYADKPRKFLFKHNKCKNEFIMSYSAFSSGHRCPKCANNHGSKSHEQFEKEIYDLVGNEYTILGKYEKSYKKILIRHNCDKCENNEYEVRPNLFLMGKQRCKLCKSNKVK